ncbi:hypothetical protein WJM97_07205 [Okeanomitos corallinicola TIOX110]|uniref:Uncharacterized protein n=1 Tax=Okeanomitos corallinicola TIOX110 TaxID=3133117 RepID=A0ABZ2UVP6_9CYAN
MSILYNLSISPEELKSQINIIEKAFYGSLTQAINRELNIP